MRLVRNSYIPLISVVIVAVLVGVAFLMPQKREPTAVQQIEPKIVQKRICLPAGDYGRKQPDDAISIGDRLKETMVKQLTNNIAGLMPLCGVVVWENNVKMAYWGFAMVIKSRDSARDDAENVAVHANKYAKLDNAKWDWSVVQIAEGEWADGRDHADQRQVMLRSAVPEMSVPPSTHDR